VRRVESDLCVQGKHEPCRALPWMAKGCGCGCHSEEHPGSPGPATQAETSVLTLRAVQVASGLLVLIALVWLITLA
jgi:hypothetical protein